MKGVLRRLPASLEEVCKRYGTVLKSIIMQILHNDAEADDVLQEVFFQVWERAPSYCSEKGTLLNWLCTIARRRAIDRLRQQNAYLRATDRYDVSCHSSNGFNESHTVSAKHLVTISVRLLHQYLARLPPHQQRVIRLAFFEEKSQREFQRSSSSSWRHENANRTRYQKTLMPSDLRTNSITSFAAIIARCVGRRWRISESLALLCRRANRLQKKILSDDAARLIFSESVGPRQCDGVKEKRSAGGTTSDTPRLLAGSHFDVA